MEPHVTGVIVGGSGGLLDIPPELMKKLGWRHQQDIVIKADRNGFTARSINAGDTLEEALRERLKKEFNVFDEKPGLL